MHVEATPWPCHLPMQTWGPRLGAAAVCRALQPCNRDREVRGGGKREWNMVYFLVAMTQWTNTPKLGHQDCKPSINSSENLCYPPQQQQEATVRDPVHPQTHLQHN